jgi:hypothetical protein
MRCRGGNLGHDGNTRWQDYPDHGRRMGRRPSRNDPGVLIMWDKVNLQATVNSFNAAVGAPGVVAPAFLGAPPFTVPGLQMHLLQRMQTLGGGGGIVGNALIAPNTVTAYKNVHGVARDLGFDPFIRAHAIVPIGHCYILADRLQANTASRDAIVHPPADLGVPLFH